MTRWRKPIVMVHPSALRAFEREGFVRIGRGGRVPAGSAFVCQVCGSRAHLGRCRRGRLLRNEREAAAFFARLVATDRQDRPASP